MLRGATFASLSAHSRLWKINVLQLAVFSFIYLTRIKVGRYWQGNSGIMNISLVFPTFSMKKPPVNRAREGRVGLSLHANLLPLRLPDLPQYTLHILAVSPLQMELPGVEICGWWHRRGKKQEFWGWMDLGASRSAKASMNRAKWMYTFQEGDAWKIE